MCARSICVLNSRTLVPCHCVPPFISKCLESCERYKKMKKNSWYTWKHCETKNESLKLRNGSKIRSQKQKRRKRGNVPKSPIAIIHSFMYQCRAQQVINELQKQGWKRVEAPTYELKFRRYAATPRQLKRNQTVTPIEVFEMVFPTSWMNDYLLPYFTTHLAKKSETTTSMSRSCQNPILSEVYIFLIITFNHVIQQPTGRTRESLCLKTGDQNAMSQDRFKAMSASLDPSSEDLLEFGDQFRTLFGENWTSGSELIHDELMNPHTGQQASKDGVFMKLERKPHSKGLITYISASRGPKSRKPYALDFELRLDIKRPTASESLKRSIARISGSTDRRIHFIADSAFYGVETVKWISQTRSVATIALSTSPSCGAKGVFDIGTQDLKEHQTRNFACRKLSAQFGLHGDLKVGCITNAWKRSDRSLPSIIPPQRKGTYQEAVSLYLDFHLSTLAQYFASENEAFMSAEELISSKTGWDVTKPNPTLSPSIAWSESTLNSYNKRHLELIRKHVDGNPPSGRPKKDELVQEIRSLSPEARAADRDEDVSPIEALEHILSTDTDDTLISFYNQHFNAVDQFNRLFYTLFINITYTKWRKLYFFTLFGIGFINCFTLYKELTTQAEGQEVSPDTDSKNLEEFITSIFITLYEKYKPVQ